MSRITLDPEVVAEIDAEKARLELPPPETRSNGLLRLVLRDADPTDDFAAGDVYFNTDLKRLRLFDGENWVTIQ
jgi:hypothetical protein